MPFAMDSGSVVLSIAQASCYTGSSSGPVSLSYDADPGATVSVVYSSSNPAVAVVHSSGKIIGYVAGSATISVLVSATGPGLDPASGTDSFVFTVEQIPAGGYSAPSGSQVGFEFPDTAFYVSPDGTDVGFQLFTVGPSLNIEMSLDFTASLEAETFLAIDMDVAIPLNFTVDGVVITFDQMSVSVPMTFGAAIEATGIGEGGAVMVPPIFGVMHVRM